VIHGIEHDEHLEIKEEQIECFFSAFKQEKPFISKCLLKSLFWAMSHAPSTSLLSFTHPIDKLTLRPENQKRLLQYAEAYINSDDKSLQNTAREIARICKSS